MKITEKVATWLTAIFTLAACLVHVVWTAVAMHPNVRDLPITKLEYCNVASEENPELNADLRGIAMRWETADEFPPISANDALKFSDRFKRTLLADTKADAWHTDGLGLMPIQHENNKWCWVASFGLWPRRGGVGGMIYCVDVYFGNEELANAIIDTNMPDHRLSIEIAKKQQEL